MIVKDLIKDKDYDYISWRVMLPDNVGNEDIFFGCCASKNGKLISLDGDVYSDEEDVLKYEEWSSPEEEVKNGLTVVIEADWLKSR